MTKTCRFVSISISVVETPAARSDSLPAMSHLVAIALLIAERDAQDAWRFSLQRHALGAGDGEDLLLAWATRAMPATGIVIGWQLADDVIAPLLETAKDIEPTVAHAFLDRLMTLVTGPSVDLAIAHGGAAASPLAQVAAEHGINVTPMSTAEIESAWAFGDVESLRSDVAQRAIAIWRLWLAEANGAGAAAQTAFEAWVLKA